jgi:hypothetical protein
VATSQGEVLDRRQASQAIGLDVVELEKGPLAASATRLRNERALPLVAEQTLRFTSAGT